MQEALFARTGSASCSTCGKEVHATILPALYKVAGMPPPSLPEEPPGPGEAACFYNPNRRATKVCDHCGVFVSDAWAAKWGSQTVCLKCIEDLRTKHKDTRFEAKRTLWDNIALFLATGPWVLAGMLIATFILYGFAFFCILATLATAPAAVFVALRYWNAPRSLVPRGRARLVWALVLSLAQVGLWMAGILTLVVQWNKL
jgi:hypothetical protein